MVRNTTVDGGCGAASYPLSPLQQGMLFHRLDGGAAGVDVEQVVGELHHAVSAAEFVEACQAMLRRHETLRTSFEWYDGAAARQMVAPPEAVTLPVRVLHFASAADAERVLEPYLAADRRDGFDRFDAAPLARAALFRSDDDHAWFVFTYHHLVMDARGMYTFFKDLLDGYDALVRGERVADSPARPYREYIAWIQTLDTHRAEAFWREQLHDFTAPTLLPLPRPDPVPALGDDAPGELVTRLGAEATAQLRDVARRREVTLNTLLQAAWAIVLSRYTGENDVVFGAVRACRHVPVEGVAAMAGMLINTVPFRVRLASAASVDHWLRALREQWVALRDYEHTPLARAQQGSGVPAGRALFDTLFNFQEPSWIGALRSLGGIWERRRFEIRSQPNYPLALDIYGDEALLIRAFYDRRRFGAGAVAGLLGHFRNALDALADPRVDTLGAISIVDAAERTRLAGGFNATATEYPRDVVVHQLFEARVAEAPDRIAVADAQTALTYGELDARANALAARLRGLAVGPDVPVVVCLERSVAMLVAWLGVLKAGGAFVPLDPTYPRDRLAFMVQDSQAPVVVTDSKLAPRMPTSSATVIRIDEPGEADPAADRSPGRPVPVAAPPRPTSRHLAYIIYTSGSTGQPKGVEIEHRSLVNLVTWHQRTYAITPDDRATQIASPAFDASVWEVWPYLTAGASVHIPDDETRISPEKLWRWMAERSITVAFLPTPLAEAAMAEPVPATLALRALLTGGDQLKRAVPADFPGALVNHYGPTEATVVATAGVVAGAAGAPPIGCPIANTEAYVLDRELRPVPVGVPGELFIGGESLARGYHHRAELTAERFLTLTNLESGHVMGDNPSGARRVYRTGDLVRWRADGQLDFLGRCDTQVKIRGCRVELGEIEAALQRHPTVREAVAVARTDERAQPQLAAYVVGKAGAAPAEPALMEFLRGVLPAYMTPTAIVVLPAWPMTPNGKIDRRALPAPPRREAACEFSEAQTGEEALVARLWGEVLGGAPLGRHDNFFERGGHSLLAAQAITRLNAALGATISVRTLFDHPTVAEFVVALGEREAEAAPRPALRPKRRATAPELELVQPR